MQRLLNFRQRLFQSRLVKNTFALSVVHFSRFLLPLVTLPYLARVLGKDVWGQVLFAQTFSAWLIILLDYGFNLSATRDIAKVQNNPSEIANVVSRVLAAKLFLIFVSSSISLVAYFFVPIFQAHPTFWLLSWLTAICTGLLPLWYFQGIEQMRTTAMLDVGSRTLAMLGAFLFIHKPSDAWLYLVFQLIAAGLASLIALTLMYRSIAFMRPRLDQVRQALRDGFSIFIFQSAMSIYVTGNTLLLGLVSTPAQVALFGNADKVFKVAANVPWPISQVLFPRINQLIAHDVFEAAKLARKSLFIMTGIGLAVGIMLFVTTPLIVKVLFGLTYEGSISVLRILSLLAPIATINTVFGVQWMLPLRLDRSFNVVVISAGLLNIVLAILLGRPFGAVGMAWSTVMSDSVVMVSLLSILTYTGKSPFSKRFVNQP